MNRKDLLNQIKSKNSYLCIGLDPDIHRMPDKFPKNPDGILEFLKEIILATQDLCIAYKPNIAFYECFGEKGWELLEEILKFIPKDQFSIVDGKRGDIGNTSAKYAEAFFNSSLPFKVDGQTVNPYMGEDSVSPFLQYIDKWAILLALTSNPGSNNFQKKKLENGRMVFEEVLMESSLWGNPDNTMYVVGATQVEAIDGIRKLIPEHFLLVPGIGSQGGDLEGISKRGLNSFGGLLINASRSILYASRNDDFAEKARQEAIGIQKEMAGYLLLKGII